MTADGSGPDVTVITIFHNEARFLPEAVASVEAQCGVRWELLLVDDGSTDQSGPWARARARTGGPDGHPVRYLSHPGRANRGMSASRNLGLQHATGKWVTFLDADDVWRPGKLSTQLALLADHPGIEVLASPAEWWWTWAGETDEVRSDWRQVLGRGRTEVLNPPVLVLDYLGDEWRSVCDLVVSRRAVDRLGGYEQAFTGMFEDQVFHAKVFGNLPSLVTEEGWYRYRQHAGACTASTHRDGGHRAARLRFLYWLDRYLREQSKGGERNPGRLELCRTVRAERRRTRYPRMARLIRSGRSRSPAAEGGADREG